MQYTEFKQVAAINDQITDLHNKLSNLYMKRAMFLSQSDSDGTPNNSTIVQEPGAKISSYDYWIEHTYSYLSAAWYVHGIAIPKLVTLEKPLQKGLNVIRRLQQLRPDIANNLGVLLVPPIDIMPFPLPYVLRSSQSHVSLPDFVNPGLLGMDLKPLKKWQVMVTHMGSTGLDLGTASQLLSDKKYRIGNYDTRGMGFHQYAALSLQLNLPIDENVWTILLDKSTTAHDQLVASVTFLNGQYRFELDEVKSELGEDRFRPAIEIKG